MKKRSRNYARRQLTWGRKIPNLDLDRPHRASATPRSPRADRRAHRVSAVNDAAVRFEKWQALGNDYLIVERERLPWELTAERVRLLCDPHFGVGADGVLLLAPQRGPGVRRRAADLQPRRLRGRALRQRRPRGDPLPAPPRLDRRRRVRDLDRRRADPADDHRRADLRGRHGPRLDRLQGLPLGRRGRPRDARAPAAASGSSSTSRSATRSARSSSTPTSSRSSTSARSGPGSKPTSSSRTAPTSPSSRSTAARVRARIFERGVGETLSSGTGASGAAVTAFLRGAASPITVELEGGELEVEIGEDLAVRLTGWARAGLRRRALAGAARGARRRRLTPRDAIGSRADGDRRSVQAPGGDASLHVRPARAADRREASRRHRRDQPRHRRPRRADLPLHRRGDAGGGRRPGQPPVPEQPRPRRVPRGLRRASTTAASGSRSTPRPR